MNSNEVQRVIEGYIKFADEIVTLKQENRSLNEALTQLESRYQSLFEMSMYLVSCMNNNKKPLKEDLERWVKPFYYKIPSLDMRCTESGKELEPSRDRIYYQKGEGFISEKELFRKESDEENIDLYAELSDYKIFKGEEIMRFAGCWEDMPDEDFENFLKDITERRKKASSGRRKSESFTD